VLQLYSINSAVVSVLPIRELLQSPNDVSDGSMIILCLEGFMWERQLTFK
jgi:hypothetical protein